MWRGDHIWTYPKVSIGVFNQTDRLFYMGQSEEFVNKSHFSIATKSYSPIWFQDRLFWGFNRTNRLFYTWVFMEELSINRILRTSTGVTDAPSRYFEFTHFPRGRSRIEVRFRPRGQEAFKRPRPPRRTLAPARARAPSPRVHRASSSVLLPGDNSQSDLFDLY